MGDSYHGKCLLIWDEGLFTDFAARMAEDDWGEVLHYKPWKKSAPETISLMAGYGIPGVTHIRDFFDAVPRADVIAFTHCYQGDLQVYLESHGKRVWGARKAERWEFMRQEFKDALKEVGLPVVPYKVIKGISRLREYLSEHDNQVVKLWNGCRGDGESFLCPSYALRKSRIDALEYAAGPFSERLTFIVEAVIESDQECGYDGICIDDQFTDGFVDYETKDESCLIACRKYEDMPEIVREVNEKFAPLLKRERYRGPLGTEIRVDKKGIGWYIDKTARTASPPGEAQWRLITNLSDIVYRGSAGEFVQAEFAAPFGCEIMLYLDWEDRRHQEIYIPDKVRPWIALSTYAKVDGLYYPIANEGHEAPLPWSTEEIGAAIGIGDTLEEAIEQAKEHAAAVEGFKIHYNVAAISDGIKSILSGEEQGIEFSEEPIPDPAIVLENGE